MRQDYIYQGHLYVSGQYSCVSGEYEISQDNIGKMSFEFLFDKTKTTEASFYFVALDNGKEIRFIGADRQLGTTSGIAKRI